MGFVEDILDQTTGPDQPRDASTTRRRTLGVGLGPATAVKTIDKSILPKEVARRNKQATNLNIPRPAIDTDPNLFSELEQEIELSKGESNYPATSRWLSNPNNAALGHTEVEKLSKIEDTAKNVGFIGSILDGVDSTQMFMYRTIDLLGELTGSDTLEDIGERGTQRQKIDLEESAKVRGKTITWKEVKKDPDLFDDFAVQQAGKQGVIMSPILLGGLAGAGAGFAVGGPPAAAIGGFFGAFFPSLVLGAGSLQEEVKQIGGEEFKAPLTVLGGGIIIATLDSILPAKVGGQIGSRIAKAFGREAAEKALQGIARKTLAANAAKAAGVGLLTEGSTEGAQTIVEKTFSAMATGTNINWQELADEFEEAVVVGGLFGGIMGGGGQVISQIGEARKTKVVLDKVDKATKETELNIIAPEEAAQHRVEVLHEQGVEKVFIDSAGLMDALTNTVDVDVPATLERLGISDQIVEAIDEGGAVEVSVEAFSAEILGQSTYELVSDHVTLNEGALTVTGAAELVASMQSDLSQELVTLDVADSVREGVQKLLAQFAEKSPLEVLRSATRSERVVLESLITKVENRAKNIAPELIKGAINDKKQQVAALDKELVALNKLSVAKESGGNISVATRQEIVRKRDRKKAIQAEIAALEEADPTPTVAPNTDVRVKAAKLRELNVTTTKESIAATKAAFKQGLSLAKKNAKTALNVITQQLRKSGLKNINPFLTDLKKAVDLETLEAELPKITAKIEAELEKQNKKEVVAALKKLLTKTKRKGRKGKFNPQIQTLFDRLRRVQSLSKVESTALLKDRMKGMAELDGIDATTRLENMILAMKVAPDQVSADNVTGLLLDLQTIFDAGKFISKQNSFAKAAKIDATREKLLDLMGPVDPVADKSAVKQFFLDAETTMVGWGGGWWNKMQRVMKSSDKAAVDSMVDTLSMYDNSRAYDKGKNKQVARLLHFIRKRLPSLTDRQLMDMWNENQSERIVLGSFIHKAIKKVNGVETVVDQVRPVVFTRAELRKRWMELQAPEVNEAIRDPHSDGYTDDIIRAIEEKLTVVDKQLIEAQFEFYEEYFDRINEAYEKAYGVSLKKLDKYSPIRRTHLENSADNEFLKGFIYRQGLPNALKERSSSVKRFHQMSDIAVMSSHIEEMEYFINFHEQVTFLHNVFDGPVLDRVQDNFGESMVKSIQEDLVWFGTRSIHSGIMNEWVATALYRNFTFAALGAKAQIMFKQVASFAIYAAHVDGVSFTKHLADVILHPIQAHKELTTLSQLFRERGANMDHDLADMARSSDLVQGSGNARRVTIETLMKMIKWGDKGAILLGGYAHYKAMLDKGATTAEAIRSFELMTVRTQQSSDIDQRSQLQRTSAFGKVFTIFQSSANALARAEYDAFVQQANKRISKQELAKQFVILHFLIPTMIQFMASGLEWEYEDQLRANLLGSLNGVFIVGGLLEMLWRQLRGTQVFQQGIRRPLDFMNLIGEALGDIAENGTDLDTYFAMNGALVKALSGVGEFSGIPLKTMINELKGFKDLSEGDLKGLLLILGYSPYTVDRAFTD